MDRRFPPRPPVTTATGMFDLTLTSSNATLNQVEATITLINAWHAATVEITDSLSNPLDLTLVSFTGGIGPGGVGGPWDTVVFAATLNLGEVYGVYGHAEISNWGDPYVAWLNISATEPVPEPSTMLLLGSGLIGLVGYGRKRFFKG